MLAGCDAHIARSKSLRETDTMLAVLLACNHVCMYAHRGLVLVCLDKVNSATFAMLSAAVVT